MGKTNKKPSASSEDSSPKKMTNGSSSANIINQIQNIAREGKLGKNEFQGSIGQVESIRMVNGRSMTAAEFKDGLREIFGRNRPNVRIKSDSFSGYMEAKEVSTNPEKFKARLQTEIVNSFENVKKEIIDYIFGHGFSNADLVEADKLFELSTNL